MALKIQTPILLANKLISEPSASSGFGKIFASGSKIYFNSHSGSGISANRNLTASGSFRIFEYTGSVFWNKPVDLSELFVVCIAGAGGGGSGAVSGNPGGGGGGTGGTIAARRFAARDLRNVSYSIVVGTGGTGGVSQTTDFTNGLGGSAGTDTTFAISGSTVLVRAVGGNVGRGGETTAGGAGGAAITNEFNTPFKFPYSLGVAGGGSATTTISNAAGNGSAGFQGIDRGAPSGAAGGSINSLSFTTNGPGGLSGGVLIANSGTVTGSVHRGTLASPNCPSSLILGSNMKRDLLFFVSSNLTTFGIGISGGGGAASTASNGGSGSGGGNYGAGGGGGGSCRTGSDSGPGGKGGDGLVYIVEYYY